MATMHHGSNVPLLIIRFLPREPLQPDMESWRTFMREMPRMSTADRACVLNEVWDATQELAEFREKLMAPMGRTASLWALCLLGQLVFGGSKKTTRAMTCVEVLNFLHRLIPELCRDNEWEQAAQALRVISSCCTVNSKKFSTVFLNASPETLIIMLARVLQHGIVADLFPGSACEQVFELVQSLLMQLGGDAREIVHKTCVAHMWPALTQLLLAPNMPDSWSAEGKQIDEKEDLQLSQSMGAPPSTCARITVPSFLEVLLSTVRCFQDSHLIRASSCGRGTDINRTFACFSDDLLCRIYDMAEAQHLPKYTRHLCNEVLDIANPVSKSTRRETQGKLQANVNLLARAMASRCQRTTLELSACGQCGAQETEDVSFKWCGGCKVERYCSDACQKKDWKRHKQQCKLGRTG